MIAETRGCVMQLALSVKATRFEILQRSGAIALTSAFQTRKTGARFGDSRSAHPGSPSGFGMGHVEGLDYR